MRTAVLNFIKQSFLLVLGMVVLFAQTGRATPIISNIVETGGDNEATDTVSAKWTGVTYVGGVANEPVPGLAAGASYTVGVFGNHAPTFVDRNHRYTNASDTVAIPAYLVGGEYIMNGNDNRDNASMTMDVTVDRAVQVYMLIDNRLGDPNSPNTDPPSFGPTKMQWVLDEGWAAVKTGANRAGDANLPDEVAIDEGADGTLNQWYSIYTKVFPAGTFRLKQADNAGQNMYGAVVTTAPVPPLSVGLNFGADDNAAALGLAATDVAGAVRQGNWNNLNGASGSAANLNAELSGVAMPTTMSVEWTSPNTWSSTGRGEENNGFPAGPDKTLMTGYIDTGNSDANKATVTVSGIPNEFTSGGYDVLVYGLGGVAGRGGAYTIGGETKFGTAPASPAAHAEDPGVGLSDTGTYVRFRGLYTSSFTLLASADPALGSGVNFRAPVNGIQIVKNADPKAGLAPGYVVKERYDNIGGSVAIADLLNNPKYINHQVDFSCLRPDFSANDANECNNCGLVVRGFFIPKATGPHTFYLSADDGAALFLSTDEVPANKVQIAVEPVWTGRRDYIGEAAGGGRGDPPLNVSAPINLTAGKYYYIEGAVKEGGGGDNLDVAVQGPGDPAVADGDRPIFGDRIAVIVDLTGSSLAITQNPASIRVPEGDSASFTVAAAAVSPLCGGITTYQWQRNEVDIPGANGASYSFGPVRVEDQLTTYRCVVRIPGITRTSAAATLEVLGRECLRVTGATGSGDLMHATVQFGTFVNATNAGTTDIFNYSIVASGTVVKGLRFTTANDAPARDPMTFTLEGTSGDPASGPWTLIASGNTGLGVARFATAPDVTFPNSANYLSYRLLFPTVRDAAAANSMQISEVAFLDAGNNDITVPGNAVIGVRAIAGSATSEVAVAGTVGGANNYPAAESPAGAIDDTSSTKYLNFAEINTGIIVTPAAATTTLGVTAAVLNGDGKSVTLTTDMQAENFLYTVSVMNVESIVGTTVCNSPTNMASFRSYQIGPCGGVLFEQYTGLSGGNVIGTLTNNPKFPNSPDVVRTLPSFAAGVGAGENFGDNYGGRLRGLFIPDATASYIFYLASDDASRLFINRTGPSAAGKVLVQEDTGCCGPYTAHATAPIPMIAGQGYYIEAIYQEGGGGDYCYVAVRKQGEAPPVGRAETDAIPGTLLGYPAAPAGIGGPLTITQQPANQTVTENAIVTFSVGASNPNGVPICYQWFDNGAEIVGATGPSYVIPLAPLSANGHTFYVRASVIGTTLLSATATLTVTTDIVGPQAVSASGSVNYSNIVVRFSELVDPGSAQDLFNYTMAGRAVVAAALQSGGQSVLVQVDPALAPDTAYQITVQNVTDLAGNALSPSPTTLSFRSYAISCGFALEQLYFNIGGVAVTDLTGNPNYPNNPGLQTYVGLLAGPTDTYDNYGTRLTGVLIPPVSGAYNFFMSSDDGGAFYLSTDASPGNAVLICSEPTWNGSRDWVGTARRNAAAPENRSSTLFPAGISLVAGQHYYFELLAKEGGGGDNCGATWQLPGAPLPANGSPPIAGIYMGAPANPVGASLAITQQPVDDSVVASDAFQTASFTVGVSASTQGNTNPPTFYQWYRRSGTNNFSPISGGNSATLTFPVTLSDNGAQFRAQVYIPGATATSQVARLTVTGGQQPNTPPRFACGTNIPPVAEGAGAQTVPNAVTDILPGSITILYGGDFNTQPPASTLYGMAAVDAGVLKLTLAVNSAFGTFYSPALAGMTESYTITFSSYMGGGTCCGDPLTGNPTSAADGFSVNVANDLPQPPAYGNPGEDGAGNGLTVQFDTWDNGGGEAPAIELEYGQVSLARVPMVPHLSQGAGAPRFIPTRIVVHANGTADVDYDGTNVVSGVVLPGYAPTAGLQLGIGARTGGANDNHWIDDLLIQATVAGSPPGESGQTVTFIASNNNPSLFSVQPAVSPTGTLTYTPAPGACGQAIVTLVAKDNGGTANGGNDTSAPCTLLIEVICGGANVCPVANAQSVTVPTGGSVPIVLTATDADGDALTYTVVTVPAHGALSGTAPNLTYTPTAGYTGADSFVFKASDGDTNCNSTATVSITVRPSTGTPPVARILAKPLYDFRPNVTNPVVISCNGSNATLQLNATRSTDAEGGALTYAWVLEPGAAPFSTNGLTEVELDLTTQTIQLAVTDPQGNVGLDSLTVEVITIGEAIDELTDKVRECTLPRAQKRSLIATLKVASALSHRGNDLFWEDDGYDSSCWRLQLAADILWVFEWKVWLHLIHRDPDLALCLMDWADQIICAIDECPCDDGGEDDYDIDYPLDP